MSRQYLMKHVEGSGSLIFSDHVNDPDPGNGLARNPEAVVVDPDLDPGKALSSDVLCILYCFLHFKLLSNQFMYY